MTSLPIGRPWRSCSIAICNWCSAVTEGTAAIRRLRSGWIAGLSSACSRNIKSLRPMMMTPEIQIEATLRVPVNHGDHRENGIRQTLRALCFQLLLFYCVILLFLIVSYCFGLDIVYL